MSCFGRFLQKQKINFLKLVHVNILIFAHFSLHPLKTITTGEGGIVTTNNQKFIKKK